MEDHERAGVGGHDAPDDLLNAHAVAVELRAVFDGDVEDADGIEVHVDCADVQHGGDASGLRHRLQFGVKCEHFLVVAAFKAVCSEYGEDNVIEKRLLSLI